MGVWDQWEKRGKGLEFPSTSPDRRLSSARGNADSPSAGSTAGGPRESALDKGIDLQKRCYPPDVWHGDGHDVFHEPSPDREWSGASGYYEDMAGGHYESAAVTNRNRVIDKPSGTARVPFTGMHDGR